MDSLASKIDAAMLQRICAKTNLALTADVADAVYQLGHLRDYYFHELARRPKITSTDLAGNISKVKSAAKTIIAALQINKISAFRDAIKAAGIDRGHSVHETNLLLTETVAHLQRLVELAAHLDRTKKEFDRSSPYQKSAWPLQGKGKRALFPFLSGSKTKTISANRRDRFLFFVYLPDMYVSFFQRQFTVTRDPSGKFSGPGIRFVVAVIKELGLNDASEVALTSQLGSFYRHEKRISKTKQAKA